MKHSHRLPACPDPLPPRFLSCLAEFADLFTLPTWPNVLMLLAGVILTPGRRTIAAALRILGRERDPQFCTFHRILNRAAWSSRAAASRLLLLLTTSFLPAAAPVVIGLDDTIERRWGSKISARGIYRDPDRQSQRSALAFRYAIGAGTLGRPHHGAAIPHRTGAFQALLCS